MCTSRWYFGTLNRKTVCHVHNELQLGSCKRDDIAARVLTRIIGHFPGPRNQLIIDAGFLALSQQGFDELRKTMAYIKVGISFFFQDSLPPSFLIFHRTMKICES